MLSCARSLIGGTRLHASHSSPCCEEHYMSILDLIISDFRKGKGFSKFNNPLLKDKEFAEKVRNTISSITFKTSLL